MIYVIAFFIAIIGIIITIKKFREGKISSPPFIFWIFVWSFLLLVSIFPKFTTILAKIFGIGRGLDIIIIIAILGCYYLLFKIYLMIEDLKTEISEIIHKLALNEGEDEDRDRD